MSGNAACDLRGDCSRSSCLSLQERFCGGNDVCGVLGVCEVFFSSSSLRGHSGGNECISSRIVFQLANNLPFGPWVSSHAALCRAMAET